MWYFDAIFYNSLCLTTYSHSQWLFYEFISYFTNKLIKQSLRVTVCFSFSHQKSANIFNFSLSSFNFNFRAIISSIEFRSEQKSSKFLIEHFDLDLGRAGEFSSDPSQISSDPMLGVNSRVHGPSQIFGYWGLKFFLEFKSITKIFAFGQGVFFLTIYNYYGPKNLSIWSGRIFWSQDTIFCEKRSATIVITKAQKNFFVWSGQVL